MYKPIKGTTTEAFAKLHEKNDDINKFVKLHFIHLKSNYLKENEIFVFDSNLARTHLGNTTKVNSELYKGSLQDQSYLTMQGGGI